MNHPQFFSSLWFRGVKPILDTDSTDTITFNIILGW